MLTVADAWPARPFVGISVLVVVVVSRFFDNKSLDWSGILLRERVREKD